MKQHLKGAAKAYVAALIGGLSYLVPVVDDGLTSGEALGAVLAALVAGQAVYWVKNKGRGQ